MPPFWPLAPRSELPSLPVHTGIWDPRADAARKEAATMEYMSLQVVRAALRSDKSEDDELWTEKDEARFQHVKCIYNLVYPPATCPPLPKSRPVQRPKPEAKPKSAASSPRSAHYELFRSHLQRSHSRDNSNNNSWRSPIPRQPVTYQEDSYPQYQAPLDTANWVQATSPVVPPAPRASPVDLHNKWRAFLRRSSNGEQNRRNLQSWVHDQQQRQQRRGLNAEAPEFIPSGSSSSSSPSPSSSSPYLKAGSSSTFSSATYASSPAWSWSSPEFYYANCLPLAQQPGPPRWEQGGEYGTAMDLEDSPEDGKWPQRMGDAGFWENAMAERRENRGRR